LLYFCFFNECFRYRQSGNVLERAFHAIGLRNRHRAGGVSVVDAVAIGGMADNETVSEKKEKGY
jgi:hypothetical protein